METRPPVQGPPRPRPGHQVISNVIIAKVPQSAAVQKQDQVENLKYFNAFVQVSAVTARVLPLQMAEVAGTECSS